VGWPVQLRGHVLAQGVAPLSLARESACHRQRQGSRETARRLHLSNSIASSLSEHGGTSSSIAVSTLIY
jgi:hypothetical protein